jgi:hypothetical protein
MNAENVLDDVMKKYPKEATKGYHYLKDWIIQAMEDYAAQKRSEQKQLSFEDVKSCCHDDSAGGGCLYLNEEKLKEIVRQRSL